MEKPVLCTCARLDDSPIAESEEVSPGVLLDYSDANAVAGVALLRLSKRSALRFETV